MHTVTVESLPDRRYAVNINNGRHFIVSDEPTEGGGDDLGPNAHELLLASLGACTAITLRMYAELKQIPLEDVSVHLTHERVVPQEPEFTSEEIAEAGFERRDLIRLDIALKGDLTPAQRERMLEIAGRCPVHRALDARPRIVMALDGAD
ncbi:MAG TPA: OsmC family protein [Dehalococcoidia bacterium]|nr:OsmC family protein [Dehalococcoidia bacterium]